jgi:peptidyl-prolyl cis-trans isomerase D
MSVIQKIRDKYARWAVVAIAVSLLGFILMDAFAGKTGMFNSRSGSALGKVGGTEIDKVKFDKKMQVFTAQFQVPPEQQSQLIQFLWDLEVSSGLVSKEADKLGLTVTDREMKDVLYGANPPQFFQKVQGLVDPNTGQFNAIAAQQYVTEVLKKKRSGDQDYDFVTANIDLLKKQRLISKYMALMANTIYFPNWFLEKRNVDNSLAGNISYVSVPYGTIPDSTIKVSDDEIKNYMSDHEDDYKRDQETRSIEYVLFSTAPSKADTAAALADIEKLKPQFEAAPDAGAFVTQQNSVIKYDDTYRGKSTIQVPAKDSIFNTPKGGIYGPYLDVNNFVLARVVDVKNLPDSVECRHILIGTVNMQTGQPTTPDSVAKAKIDSIALAIKNGASFDLLDSLYSTDEVAKKDKGVMTFPTEQIQGPNFAKEFGQFILYDGKPGDKKVVKTQFGWHYIEIMKHINVQPYYKVAYLAREISTSPETDNDVNNIARMFAGDSRDAKSFNDNYEKNLKPKGYIKQIAKDIDPMQFNLNGVSGSSRSFIKKVFDVDRNEVIGPEMIPENYVVAIVTEINKPGLPSVASVREMIEPIIRNKKKGEMIVKNIGQVSTLEQVSSKVNQPIQKADSIRFGGGGPLGFETKVLGATFFPGNKGKVVTQPIVGKAAVFVIRVDDSFTTPVESANIEEQRKSYEAQAKQSLTGQQTGTNPVLDPLKKATKVKDYRADFY